MMKKPSVLTRLLLLVLSSVFVLTGCKREKPAPAPDGDGEGGKTTVRAELLIDYLLEQDAAFFSAKIGGEDFVVEVTRRESNIEEGEDFDTLVVTDTHESGLVFETTVLLYHAYDAMEIVTRVKNGGGSNSPAISDFSMVSLDLPIPGEGKINLETTRGCLATGATDHYDFSAVNYTLGVGGDLTLAPRGGRSADHAWPYFDISSSEGGAVVAIGWTGQWEASFSRIPGGVKMEAGQQYFDAYLLPNEEIRTVSATIVFYDGASEDGRNEFRQLYMHHYTPENVKDEDFVFPISIGRTTLEGGDSAPNVEATLGSVNYYQSIGMEDLALWVDAGWYGNGDVWSNEVGNWYPDARVGKEGLLELSKKTHEAGYRFILWLEPERAMPGTQAVKEHPDAFTTFTTGLGHLVRLDTEAGYNWMLDLLSDHIQAYGMDIYRQDFNIQPLPYWLATDDEGRQGITENHYITNLYRLLDELLVKYPHLVIDNCASGGRRLDIEMMRRCISLFRSDYSCTPNNTVEGYQSHQQNLLSWIPYTSAGFNGSTQNDPYLAYSMVNVGFIIGGGDWLIETCQELAPIYDGDFYRLRETTVDTTSHQAWMLYHDEIGKGLVIAIAREETPDGDLRLNLKGLDEKARYEVSFYGDDEVWCTATGAQLMRQGVDVNLRSRSAKMLIITEVKGEETA